MTMKQMAQMALDIQNACNLSGVARSFAEVTAAMRQAPHNFDTATCNCHPVTVLFVDKLNSLCGMTTMDILAIYRECERLAGTDGTIVTGSDGRD